MPINPIGPAGPLQPALPLREERRGGQGSVFFSDAPEEVAGSQEDRVSLSPAARTLSAAASGSEDQPELRLSPAELRRLITPENDSNGEDPHVA